MQNSVRSLLRLSFIAALSLPLLSGCDGEESKDCCEEMAVTTSTVETLSVENSQEDTVSYQCDDLANLTLLGSTWCQAKQQFDMLDYVDDFELYLVGYRQGYSDASRAATPRVALALDTSVEQANVPESMVDAGYHDGYLAVTQHMGIQSFNCTQAEDSTDYEDLWCLAAQAYHAQKQDNPFMKACFIQGYIAGGRTALSAQSSMESMLGGSGMLDVKSQIAPLSQHASAPEQAFHRGFETGMQAMLDSIRQSIEQVMQQMRMPENMEMLQNMMPQQ